MTVGYHDVVESPRISQEASGDGGGRVKRALCRTWTKAEKGEREEMAEKQRDGGAGGSGGGGAVRDPRHHVYPVLGALVVVAVVAIAARSVAVPETFGEYGTYRAAAVTEAMERAPRHVGEAVCEECHDDIVAIHDKDVHVHVQCETCHGPGSTHVEKEDGTEIIRPQGKEFCLTCHRLLLARPGPFPQVRWKEHFEFVGVKDETIDCTACHDPHEPLYLDRDIHSARLHPLIQRCRDCHVGMQEDSSAKPPDHPQVFECGYCHEEKVKDFARRTHAKVSCTTCHLFIKESSFSGRIIRDADPRFCLLCHRDAEFRSVNSAPGIDWPAHLDDVKEGPEDEGKRCIDCHRDRIHAPVSEGRPQQ